MMKSDTLFEKLKNNHLEGSYPFHMPGHKRQMPFSENMFQLDITEIEGFDSLHHANGILEMTSRRAAALYQAEDSYLLVNGSTAGLLCAIAACKNRGKTLVMARNCHKAVYHGAYVNGYTTEFLYPKQLKQWGIYGGIALKDVEHILADREDVAAVVITSPTYEGVVSNIEAIARCCHKYDVPLIVDEAHGAHFGFHFGFPNSAVTLGADCVIQSLHKTMPSLTQTALLHVNGKLVDRSRIQRFFSVYQSSSPSYLLLGSIDQCIGYMEQNREELFAVFFKRVERCRKRLEKCKCIRLFSLTEEEKSKTACMGQDLSRFVFSLRGAGLSREFSGSWLMKRLREEFSLEMEMAGLDYVTAIVTMMDTEEGLESLCAAILQLDKEMAVRLSLIKNSQGQSMKQYENDSGKKHPITGDEERLVRALDIPKVIAGTTIAKAYDGPWKECLLKEAVGKISAEFIFVYPPGIPIVAPGELVQEQHLEYICQAQRQGLSVEGIQDSTLTYLRVCIEV